MTTKKGKIGIWRSCAGDESRIRRIGKEIEHFGEWILRVWIPAIRNVNAAAVMFWCLGGRPDDLCDLDFDAITSARRQGAFPLTPENIHTAFTALANELAGLSPENASDKIDGWVVKTGYTTPPTYLMRDRTIGVDLAKVWVFASIAAAAAYQAEGERIVPVHRVGKTFRVSEINSNGNTKIVSYHGSLNVSSRDGKTGYMGVQWGKLGYERTQMLVGEELNNYNSFADSHPFNLEIALDASGDMTAGSAATWTDDACYARQMNIACEPIPAPDCWIVPFAGKRSCCYVRADTLRDYERNNFGPTYNVMNPAQCAAANITINVLIDSFKPSDAADCRRWLDAGFNVWLDLDSAALPGASFLADYAAA